MTTLPPAPVLAITATHQRLADPGAVTYSHGVEGLWDQGTAGMARPQQIRYERTSNRSVLWSSGSFSYDAAGNVRAIGAEFYVYDTGQRLVKGSARRATSNQQEYTYDAYDNLTGMRHDHGAWSTYQVDGKNRFRRGGPGTPDTFYDTSGNMLRTGQQPNGSPALTWTWDSLGMAIDHSVYEGAVGQTYTYPQIYGPGNYRLLTLDSGRGLREYTLRDLGGKVLRLWEVRGWGAYQSPTTPGQQMTFVKDYLHGAEGVFGSWGNGGVKRFFHNDHLGSPRLITGDDGANPLAVLSTRYYYPYGTDFGSGSTHDDRISKFTSHERDIPRRTDHMLARTYATPLQRFLSPDPGRDGWNLYGYAWEGPLNFVDPDGKKVDVSALEEAQQDALVEGLRSFTGNEYAVDDDGFLQLVAVGADSSVTATEFISDAIESEETYTVVAGSNGNRLLPDGQIELDFSSFTGAQYGEVDPRTFNLGSAFVHELYHRTSGLKDAVGGVVSHTTDWTGPVVDFVNGMRMERGLPRRAAYIGEAVGKWQKIYFDHVVGKKPDKRFPVKRAQR